MVGGQGARHTLQHVRGFSYDSRSKQARFEVVIPGTRSRVRRRKWTTAPTRAAALALWREFRNQVLSGARPDPITLHAYVQTYWPLLCQRASPRTARDETYMLKKHLVSRLGHLPLERLTSAVVKDLIASLKQQGYSPATINAVVNGLLCRVLRDAQERDLLAAYPIKGKIPVQRVPILRLELTPEEQERFLAAFDDTEGFRRYLASLRGKPTPRSSDHYAVPRRFGESMTPTSEAARIYEARFAASKPLFVLALHTGLRRGDLLDLRWESIRDGWLARTLRKTKSTITIPLSRAALEAIEEFKKRGPTQPHDHVTRHPNGHHYDVSTLNRYFTIAKVIAGITRRLRLHDLRHTFASTLATKGVSLQLISQALGHTTTRMTERYAKPAHNAMNAITKALNSW